MFFLFCRLKYYTESHHTPLLVPATSAASAEKRQGDLEKWRAVTTSQKQGLRPSGRSQMFCETLKPMPRRRVERTKRKVKKFCRSQRFNLPIRVSLRPCDDAGNRYEFRICDFGENEFSLARKMALTEQRLTSPRAAGRRRRGMTQRELVDNEFPSSFVTIISEVDFLSCAGPSLPELSSA